MEKTLGTSDAWLMSHLSHRPNEPAYYIVDCGRSAVPDPKGKDNPYLP